MKAYMSNTPYCRGGESLSLLDPVTRPSWQAAAELEARRILADSEPGIGRDSEHGHTGPWAVSCGNDWVDAGQLLAESLSRFLAE